MANTKNYNVDIEKLSARLEENGLDKLTPLLLPILASVDAHHGHLEKWLQAIASLPDINVSECDFSQDAVTLLSKDDLSNSQTDNLLAALQQLKPWRKGPFQFFNTFVDTEWRSQIKWQRIQQHIDNGTIALAQKRILDVGCGNGYYAYRMLANKARYVLGIDPSLHYCCQFNAVNKYAQSDKVDVLPLTLEHFYDEQIADKNKMQQFDGFDTIFSMGVLYHRRSPIEHIFQLKQLLTKGGQLVLETLVIDSMDANQVLVPSDRYAGMSNVWFIPSVAALEKWLYRCGFSNVKVLDVSPTTVDEQRKTSWIDSFSLDNFLQDDEQSSELSTIEGLPAPLRVVISANKE